MSQQRSSLLNFTWLQQQLRQQSLRKSLGDRAHQQQQQQQHYRHPWFLSGFRCGHWWPFRRHQSADLARSLFATLQRQLMFYVASAVKFAGRTAPSAVQYLPSRRFVTRAGMGQGVLFYGSPGDVVVTSTQEVISQTAVAATTSAQATPVPPSVAAAVSLPSALFDRQKRRRSVQVQLFQQPKRKCIKKLPNSTNNSCSVLLLSNGEKLSGLSSQAIIQLVRSMSTDSNGSSQVNGDSKQSQQKESLEKSSQKQQQQQPASSSSSSMMPRLPTRAEMLEGISGFWARLSVNLRFALTRTKRPWTTDDILAMISWILMSNVAFFLLASTTFVSLVLFVINSLQFQEFAANQIAKLISRAIGSSVTIGASVVPDWSSGHITLKNVIWNVGPQHALPIKAEQLGGAEHSADEQRHSMDLFMPQHSSSHIQNPSNGHGQHQQHHQQHHQQQQQQSTDQSMDNEYQEQTEYDMNFSFCDLTFDQIDVQLDFWRWLDGRGPIKSVNVRGVRGVIDQRHMPPYPPDYDAASDRLTRIPGHFEMDNVQLEDMMVTWLQYNFRPVPVSIFAMNLPRLRQQFMMLDVMSADNIAGTFDNCLFSLHKAQQSSFPQTELRFSTAENRAVVSEKTPVKRFKIRLDGLPVDHMSSGASGPLSWLTAGTIDMQATIEIPLEEERPLLQEIIQDLTDLTDSIEFTVLADRIQEFVVIAPPQRSPTAEQTAPHQPSVSLSTKSRTPLQISLQQQQQQQKQQEQKQQQQQQQQARPRRPVSTDIKIDLDLQFRNLKASVPLANDDLSYWNNAIVRPVVAFMNANRTFMPIKCSANLPLSNFNGAWGVGDSEIKPILENATSEEFVRLTRDHRVRSRRMKRVGLWGLQALTKQVISLYQYARGKLDFFDWTGIPMTI